MIAHDDSSVNLPFYLKKGISFISQGRITWDIPTVGHKTFWSTITYLQLGNPIAL